MITRIMFHFFLYQMVSDSADQSECPRSDSLVKVFLLGWKSPTGNKCGLNVEIISGGMILGQLPFIHYS